VPFSLVSGDRRSVSVEGQIVKEGEVFIQANEAERDRGLELP
jgi:hypothetical protein